MYDNEAKFSLWCDFIERDFLQNEFNSLLEKGVINGATSNPAIFKTAFASPAYKQIIQNSNKRHPKDLYEILATQDIKMAMMALLALRLIQI